MPGFDEKKIRAAFEKFSRRFLPDAADGFGDQDKAAFRFTNSRAREKWSSASRGWCTFIATRSIASRCRRSISRVVCSKGFYVRTYAHDIGETLGCGAHLQSLRRTKSGRFSVDGAMTVEELKTAEPRRRFSTAFSACPKFRACAEPNELF